MYHPYFRGKQFELITIREMAPLLAEKNFIPVIEPVREALGGLKKTLSAICAAGGRAILIVNPYHGDHQEDGTGITDLLKEGYIGVDNIAAGILLRSDMTVEWRSPSYSFTDDDENRRPERPHVCAIGPLPLATG